MLGRCLHTAGLTAAEANTSHQHTMCVLASGNVYCSIQLRSENIYLGSKKSNSCIFSVMLYAGASDETCEPSACPLFFHLS